MGHANYENISKRVNKLLRGNEDGASIRECVEALVQAKQGVSASEGVLMDREDIGRAVEELFAWLLEIGAIEPLPSTRLERKLFNEWQNGGGENWGSGSNGEGGEYGVFDRMRWKALKKRLPVLGPVTH